MNVTSKNVCLKKVDNIVNKHNQKFQRTIKMKPKDFRSITHIDFDLENNDYDAKFKVDDHIKI